MADDIKRISDTALRELAKQVIRNKDKEGKEGVQRRLLIATRDGAATFVRFIEDATGGATEGQIDLDLPQIPLCGNEFANLPADSMRRLADLWPNLEKRDASLSGVWARVNIRMVQENLIEPSFFAGGHAGAAEIDKVLNKKDEAPAGKEGDKKKRDPVDGCARLIVRSFAGCREIRGIRSLYQDCAPARAWWTCRLADEAAKALNMEPDIVLEVLQRKAVWDNLSERIVSSLTVLGDKNIRDGIILFLQQEYLKGEELKGLFRKIGQMCAWRALGFFERNRVAEIIRDEIMQLDTAMPL